MLNFEEAMNWLFSEYERNDIRYCVLRNYERLPESNVGNDIDFLIDARDMERNDEVLKRLSSKFEWRLFSMSNKYNMSSYQFINCEGEDVSFLTFDFFNFIGWKSAVLLDTETVLKKRLRYNNLYIPQKSHECIITFFHHMLWSGFLRKEAYKTLVRTQIDDACVMGVIREIFRHKLAERIRQDIISNDFCNFMGYQNELRFRLITFNIRRRPAKFIGSTLRMLKEDLKSLFIIRGKLLVINPALYEDLINQGFEKKLKSSNRRNQMIFVPYVVGSNKGRIHSLIEFMYFYFSRCYIPLVHSACILVSHPIIENKTTSVFMQNLMRITYIVSTEKKLFRCLIGTP